MPIQPGSRLGAYGIVAAIGAGGMGEVYRAPDTRLDGGSTPRWRGDGRELFYLAPDGGVMAMDVTVTDGRVRVSAPKRLFTAPPLEGRANGHYDVTADGQRFLLNVATGAGPVAPVTVVLNWAAELGRQY